MTHSENTLRPLPSTPSQQGFTIVEVLVALVLLGVAVMMTVQLTTQNQNALAQTHQQDIATMLARKKLFELEEDGISASTGKSGDFDNEHRDFSWKATAHATDISEIYRLLLIVSWGKEEEKHVAIEKLFKE